MADINKVFNSKIDKWSERGVDEKIECAMDRFEEWISGYNEEEKEILSKLISNFNYYSREKAIDAIKKMNEELERKYSITSDDTIVSIIRKNNGLINSSYEYWFIHCNQSSLSKNVYYESFDSIDEEEWKNINNVIFIDDCSGTGNQFTNFLKKQEKDFSNKNIFFLVIEIMEDAEKNIKKYAKENGINIEIIYFTLKKKAFENKEDNKKLFSNMSHRKQITDKYILGYKEAQSLMAFYTNTPNDTLRVFWLLSAKNKPIFERKKSKEPKWKKIKKEKKGRRKQQYEAKK